MGASPVSDWVSSFTVAVPADVAGPVTGRAYVLMSHVSEPEPRLQRVGWGSMEPIFAIDVSGLEPGATVLFEAATPGYPDATLAAAAPGRYTVQALVDVYEHYRRGDGHELWAPHVGWEGRAFTKTPGNLHSRPLTIDFDPRAEGSLTLVVDERIPPLEPPADTPWVKRLRIESALLSEFWGRPMELGATVLLPAGYDDEPALDYPVLYLQSHFSLSAPFGFPEHEAEAGHTTLGNAIEQEAEGYQHELGQLETPAEFRERWCGPDLPRMLVVTLQHPNPWFDSSHAVNSDNCGPYEDAIMTELIPAIEERFRVIRAPHARVMTGGSTGGMTALSLQVRHPEFFGGSWILFPDPVDFRRLVLTDIYADANAYVADDEGDRARDQRFGSQSWPNGERPFRRSVEGQVQVTMREMCRLESVLASRCRSGVQIQPWHAIFGPVGEDGYPRPLWDERTGEIDREVAFHWRDRGYDIAHHLREHWPRIGPQLVGKLHFFAGDMDNYYLNVAMYELEDFLEATTDPHYDGSFHFGRPRQGHYYVPWRHEQLIRIVAEHMRAHAPAGSDTRWLSA